MHLTNSYKPIIDSNYIETKYGRELVNPLVQDPIIKNNFIQFVQYGAEAILLELVVRFNNDL